MIEVHAENFGELSRMLESIPSDAEKVLERSMNRGLDAAKTRAYRGVSQVYDITQAELKSNSRFWIKRAVKSNDQIIGYIKYTGGKIPLYKFSTNKRNARGLPVAVKVRKESRTTALESAFVAIMPSGHIGIFERMQGEYSEKRRDRTKDRRKTKFSEQIEEKYGPSLPEMLEEENVMETMQDEVQEIVNKRVLHEVERLLRGR